MYQLELISLLLSYFEDHGSREWLNGTSHAVTGGVHLHGVFPPGCLCSHEGLYE